jgi:hypothetical protein
MDILKEEELKLVAGGGETVGRLMEKLAEIQEAGKLRAANPDAADKVLAHLTGFVVPIIGENAP